MRVLLISCYELGHQPLHVAAPAAELLAAGIEVEALDLAVEPWEVGRLEGIDAVAVSVPMHTALRLAIEAATRIRRARPQMPIAFYGLYAAVGAEETGSMVDRMICGEYEEQLVEWVRGLGDPEPTRGTSVEIGRRTFRPPARHLLPGLDRYAHLAVGDDHRLVGYVEASHGCRHRCAHCPVPVVYDGRYRITGEETTLSDISQLVEAGASHVTFGDPDFLNAPAYAMKVLNGAHRLFPDLTFDVTVKVEHVLAHRDLLPALADAGILFMISAFETLDDRTLARLRKGHTAQDAALAVELAREAGIDIHPTWMPFTPWTNVSHVADIARFLWDKDLAPVTDPVQLTIRLLIPDGSLMLDVADLADHLTGYDPQALGYTWRAADPAADALQKRLEELAGQGASAGRDPLETLEIMTEVIAAAADLAISASIPSGAAAGRPRMTEPWFC
jgi:radical SAM superfamily enzyme YgiQ (UPF0313 family)